MPMSKKNEAEVYIPWTKDEFYRELKERGLHAHAVRKLWGIGPDTFTYILTRDAKTGYIRVPHHWAVTLANYLGLSLDTLLQQVQMMTFDQLAAETGQEIAALIEVAKDEGIRIDTYMGKAAFRANSDKGRLIIEAAQQAKENLPMQQKAEVHHISEENRYPFISTEGLGITDYLERHKHSPVGSAKDRRSEAIARARRLMANGPVDIQLADARAVFGVPHNEFMRWHKAGKVNGYRARRKGMSNTAMVASIDDDFLTYLESRRWCATPSDKLERLIGEEHERYVPPMPSEKEVVTVDKVVYRQKIGRFRRFIARMIGVELPEYVEYRD